MNVIEKTLVILSSLIVMNGCAVNPSEVGVEMKPHELSSAERKMLTSINVASVGVAASNLNSVINGGVVVHGIEGVGITRTDVTDEMRNDIPWLLKILDFKTKRYLIMKKYTSTTEKECHYEGGSMITIGMQLCMDFIWQKNIDNGDYELSTWSEFTEGK